MSYLLWLALFVLTPLIILWAMYFKTLKRYVRIYVIVVACVLVVSVPWDYISIKERIWYFTPPYIMDVWLLGIPIEEWMLYVFFSILLATVTTLLWERFGDKNYVR